MPITKTGTLSFKELKKKLIEIISQGSEDEAFINGQKFLKFYELDINRLTIKQQYEIKMIVEF